jgi:uncharacterized protein YggU (UPF0235/DUF167 family)
MDPTPLSPPAAGWIGERNGALVVRVTAPPVVNRANDAVRKLLARRLRIAPSRVSVVRGASSRDKLIEVDDIDAQALRQELGLDATT